MERAKSAMYEQAGRNRGWSTVNSSGGEVSAAPPLASVTPVPEPIPMPAPIMPTPTPMPMPAPTMPMPVPMFEPMRIPEPPVVEMPEFMRPQDDCQTIAMAFVQMQKWQGLYEPERGFSCGTMFAELDLPWLGEGACKNE